MEKMRESSLSYPVGPVLIIAAVVLFSAMFQTGGVEEVVVEAAPEKSKKVFENLELEAKAVYIWDVLGQKEVYSRNPEAQLHLASLSKVMAAVTALESLPEGTIITVSESDLLPEGDSGLFAQEKWTLKDLIDYSLVVSSNDGIAAVASAVGAVSGVGEEGKFVTMMNEKARELGLKQTYFTSASGLDKDDIIAGGSGSARDVARLFEYAIKNHRSVMEGTTYGSLDFVSLSNFAHLAENTNELVDKLPGVVASKTGFTDIAGGNLAIVFEPEPGRPIVLVVLGSSIEGRFEDMEKLYLTTLDYIN